MVRRLRFPAKVLKHDPRLLRDYLALWAGARRAADQPGWSPGDEHDVLTWEAAARRAGAGPAPPEPGPAHAAARSRANGRGWGVMAADPSLGELAYALVRAVRPSLVVETGVASGISSAFVLAALEDNGHGELHSIDLPPPRMVDADAVGAAIPPDLRVRWHYHWGASRRLLPRLLTGTVGSPRVFIHDSDHSYENMRWELETAWRALAPGDVLLADDVHFHSGFAHAARAVGGRPLFVAQPESGGATGLLVRE
jgi:predicted O-methyltransferase YrrM